MLGRRTSAMLMLSIGSLLVLCALAPARGEDLDEDGLDDSLEQTLIDTYRPRLYYDSAEDDKWPASVDWYVRRCDLIYDGWIIYNRAQLASNPLLILQGTDIAPGAEPSTTIWHPSESLWRLDPPDSAHYGQGPIPVGTYGHVVPLTGPIVQDWYPLLPVEPGDLLVQYWQFFPHNDSQHDSGCGDHEGDWIYLDAYVARDAPHALRFLVYHHHGDKTCPPTVLGPGGDLPLPEDGVPKCYVEEGSHEWWPWAGPGGHCTKSLWENENHDGLGPNYRTENVINLGEPFAPMPGIEPQLVLLFNGKWGYDADNCWPFNEAEPAASPLYQLYPQPPLMVVYVDATAAAWSQAGLGSRYHPYASAVDGVNHVEPNGHVRLAPGSYPGAVTISKAMLLEVWGSGTVTIGQ